MLLQGYQCFLTCIDRFTGWPNVFPMIDQFANTITSTFYMPDGLLDSAFQKQLRSIKVVSSKTIYFNHFQNFWELIEFKQQHYISPQWYFGAISETNEK